MGESNIARLKNQIVQASQQEPLFQPGALIQRASGNTTLYRVTFIQYIERIPYYHLISRDRRYLILPHDQIHQWRAAATNDISEQITSKIDRLPS